VVDADLIAATEAFAIGFPLLHRQMRMAVFVPVVDIGAAVILIISSGAFKSIMETLTTERVEFVGSRVPGAHYARRSRHGTVDEVRHAALVAAAEALTVGATHGWRHIVGMPELIAVIYVGLTMVFSIASRTFDAVVKAPALNIVPGIVGAIPAAAIVAILCDSGCERGWRSCVDARCRE